jgi:hypothetical protein
MTAAKDIVDELSYRIDAEAAHFGGTMPEKTAICWRGYLAAMLERGMLQPDQYDGLLVRVPDVEQDPAIDLLRGRGSIDDDIHNI